MASSPKKTPPPRSKIGCLTRRLDRLSLLDPLLSLKYRLCRSQATILMYHRIIDDPAKNPFSDVVVSATTEQFEEQMRYLTQHAKIVSLEQLPEAMREQETRVEQRRGMPSRPLVAITFDDGYLDNYENAFPILRRLGLPATIFLTTGFISTDKKPWWDTVGYALKHAKTDKKRADIKGLGKVTLDASSQSSICERLKEVPREQRETIIQDLLRRTNTSPPSRRLFMRWEEIREMEKHGIAFGAHTVHHPLLARIPKEEAEKEILLSREKIEQETGKKATLFAFPNGTKLDMADHLKRFLKDQGFALSCSTRYGRVGPGVDRYAIPRIGISPHDHLPMFKAKLAGLGESFFGRRG